MSLGRGSCLSITLRLFARLRTIAADDHVKVPLNEAPTVRDAIKVMAKRYGKDFEDIALGNKPGEMPVFIMLNREQIIRKNTLGTPLKDGDEISFLPLVGGG